jgi:cellobiose-specific phosphotransferase system component IIA
MAYETFSNESQQARRRIDEAKKDTSQGRLSAAKEKLRQVVNDLKECEDAGAKLLSDEANELLKELDNL